MRKKILIITLLAAILAAGGLYAEQKFLDKKFRRKAAAKEVSRLNLKDGDIIFQTDRSEQSKAIQLATHSPFSHCGIIYRDGTKYYVAEAVQPVRKTPLDKWIARGQDGYFVIKRLKDAERILTPETIAKMKSVSDNFIGKNYDIYFGWSDDKIYCSELVWKVYKRGAGIEVGKLERLRDFDLSNEIVKEIVTERYGANVPLDEMVISPASIFDSDLLITVKSN